MTFDSDGRSQQSAGATRRRQAIAMVTWMLPKPYNFASAMGRGLRKQRLWKELCEFDFLYRMCRGEEPSLDQLVCLAMVLVASCKGRVPTTGLPPDEPLMVNSGTFERLLGEVDERIALACGT